MAVAINLSPVVTNLAKADLPTPNPQVVDTQAQDQATKAHSQATKAQVQATRNIPQLTKRLQTQCLTQTPIFRVEKHTNH